MFFILEMSILKFDLRSRSKCNLSTGCVIIFDDFLVCSPARTVIGSQIVDGCTRIMCTRIMTFESHLITNKQVKRSFVADRLRAAAGSGSTGMHFAERCCVFRRTL